MEVLKGLLNNLADALLYLMVAEAGAHSGARSRHGLPVSGIRKNAFNKGPLATHMRLNRMNRTALIPENTITIFSLGNQRLASGHLTIAPHKSFAIQAQVAADIVNLSLGDIGAAIAFAALSAILAFKQIVRLNKRIRGHGASPWPFSV
jgi:hypothetical protein